MSKPKTLTERFLGKTIRLVDGLDYKVIEVPGMVDGQEMLVLEDVPNDCLIDLPVAEVEARGGKFFQVASGVVVSEPSMLGNWTEPVTEEIPQVIVECQFCRHKFNLIDGGYEKPENIADVCQPCLTIAEDRILSLGIPGHTVTEESIIEFLSRFYGLVKDPIIITSHDSLQPVATELIVQDNSEQLALMGEIKSILEELKLVLAEVRKPASLDMTDLLKETVGAITEPETPVPVPVVPLDPGAPEDSIRIGDFFRLQNMKDPANNKKLVKVYDCVLSELSATRYLVEDAEGSKYKVVATKLKPSIKSF